MNKLAKTVDLMHMTYEEVVKHKEENNVKEITLVNGGMKVDYNYLLNNVRVDYTDSSEGWEDE